MAELEAALAALRDGARAKGGVPMVELTPAEARERVVAGQALCAVGPDVPVTDTVASAEGHAVPVRVYRAASAAAVLVYAHGGGWVTGDLDYADELLRHLAAHAGCTVVSVDYRLAPEHPWPAALDDVRTAFAWATDSLAEGRPVGIGGDSAGGNLAAVVTRDLRSSTVAPAFQVLVYPVLDGSMRSPSYDACATAFPIGSAEMRWFFDHYVHERDRRHPRVSPADAPPFGGPPTHVVVAGHDPLHDEGLAYARALAEAGVSVTRDDHAELCHGFLRFTAASPGSARARDLLVQRVRAVAASAERSDIIDPRGIDAYDAPARVGGPSTDQPRESR